MYRNYDPFREFRELSNEFDRLFDTDSWPFRGRAAFLPGLSARAYPLVNAVESEDGITIEALAPGLDPSKLEITVHGNSVTISGEKVAPSSDIPKEAWHRNERAAGRFVRTFTLPKDVAQDGITAQYANGVLTVHLPKSEEARPRRIAVSVN